MAEAECADEGGTHDSECVLKMKRSAVFWRRKIGAVIQAVRKLEKQPR